MRPAIPILLFILVFTRPCMAQQAEISGRLLLDTTWSNEVYVSLVPDFSQMYTASDAMITAKTAISADGTFSLIFAARKEPALYRLHIIKKGDPASTLIIGGKDENHVFFVSAASGKTYLSHANKNAPLSQAEIEGAAPDKDLQHFFAVIHESDNDQTREGRELTKNKLIDLADSSSSQLVSLLAISYTFGLDAKQKERISTIVSRFGTGNPYGTNIVEQYQKQHNWYIIAIIIVVVVVLIAIVAGIRLSRKRAIVKLFSTLSQREGMIIKLIADGKSNKEIAAELNVELSTVKTHVNNIYTKLNAKGRKDILAYKTMFKKYGL